MAEKLKTAVAVVGISCAPEGLLTGLDANILAAGLRAY